MFHRSFSTGIMIHSHVYSQSRLREDHIVYDLCGGSMQ